MSAERPEHTLQPTALVHEAYLRLLGGNDQAWASRAHFFGAAAQAMRRILVEQARARHRAKRGGARHRTTLGDQLATVPTDPEQFLDLDRALTALEARDPAMAEVVRLRYFVGLTVPETAELLATSERSVNRLWTSARAWLLASLEPTASREDDLS